jgi:hypothetical protein
MSEREPNGPGGHGTLPLSASGRGTGGGVNLEEARLRALCRTAYLPLKPSDALRRRVASTSHAQPVRQCPWWRPQPTGWRLAVGAGVVSLLAALGLALFRSEPGRSTQPRVTRIAKRSQPAHSVPAPPRSARRLAPRAEGQTTADAGRGTPHARGSNSSSDQRPAPSAQRLPSPDDLVSINRGVPRGVFPTASPLTGTWDEIEARARHNVCVQDDFVRIPFPRLASISDRQVAEAVESYKREAAIVDARLAREVTLEQKATALTDLCEQLRSNTGIQLAAGQSVGDEKVTLFCEKMPLRDVMRQLSRPFGYTWLRSGKEGAYRYELVQDLRSQLLEEDLRNRDRNEALLALDQEMQRYRSYLSLSADEALARSRTAAPVEKQRLENYAKEGWGAIQMYFRLSSHDLATLRSGQGITYSSAPKPSELPLPPELARGVLQSLRAWRVRSHEGRLVIGGAEEFPDGQLPASVPEAQALVELNIDHSELGQFSYSSGSGFRIGGSTSTNTEKLAVGVSPAAHHPQNEVANAKLARDPDLRARVSVRPRSSCRPDTSDRLAPDRSGEQPPLPASGRGLGGEVNPENVTTADVLEALHRATGLPIVADFYTRLYRTGEVSVTNQPLFEALNHLGDGMRLRWNKEGAWLQFRSATYYDDRVKEVPNRLLSRWAASRAQHGALTLEDLTEIAQLTEMQLDSDVIAEGVRDCFGLAEWDLVRNRGLRPHLRYLAQLTPAQMSEAQSAAGLAFDRMSLAQQREFLARAVGTGSNRLPALEALAKASLRLQYELPGGFRWDPPENADGAPRRRSIKLSPVRERTREAALQSARRIDPNVSEAQIVPTELAMRLTYAIGNPQTGGSILEMCATPGGTSSRSNDFAPQDSRQ